MTTQHATPPRFGTTPIEEGDDIFLLQGQTCVDCGDAFLTSQPADRCASCRALRFGPVGPATVVCPICGSEHQVSVLSPTKLCGPCRVDPELCAANIAADVARAEAAWAEATERLNTAVDVASEANVRRFNIAVAAKETGKMGGKQYSAAQMAQSWARALAAGDGLSVLLEAHEALQAAMTELKRVGEWAAQAHAELRAGGQENDPPTCQRCRRPLTWEECSACAHDNADCEECGGAGGWWTCTHADCPLGRP